MKVTKAIYLCSAVKNEQYPAQGLPEIAFVGRSNVGKSSLINTLVNRKGLVKTSSKPGKTRTINFFEINDALNLVDLPGYGYAAVSHQIQALWASFVGEYLNKREELKGVIHLIDIRHEPTTLDVQMYEWLNKNGVPSLLVATKADKISKGQRSKHVKAIKTKLDVDSQRQVIAFSAITREGKMEIWSWIREHAGI
ncbi:MAG: ribosome biogenesis GTP-binding protein YihA/YsxC [Bacillota bacterium]